MPGRLLVVATPIGNLDDLSPRAAAALGEADLVLAEDTRRTGRLLTHLGVGTPQRSFHEHNEAERLAEVLERLRAGAVVALVSDAGTPAVSDPGYRLVAACHDAGVEVLAVPGPSAILHALVTSGLPTDRFVFEGFLPRKGAARRRRLDEIAAEPRTVVLFLSPHRADADLSDLAAACGRDRPAALARELTKLHEETVRASLGRLSDRAAAERVRGEVTVVVGGAPPVTDVPTTTVELAARVAAAEAAGVDRKSAMKQVARDAGVSKSQVYDAVLAARSDHG